MSVTKNKHPLYKSKKKTRFRAAIILLISSFMISPYAFSQDDLEDLNIPEPGEPTMKQVIEESEPKSPFVQEKPAAAARPIVTVKKPKAKSKLLPFCKVIGDDLLCKPEHISACFCRKQ